MVHPSAETRRAVLRSKTISAFRALRSMRPKVSFRIAPHGRTRVVSHVGGRTWVRAMRNFAKVVAERRGRKRAVVKRIVGLTLSTAVTFSLAPLSYLTAALWPEGSAAGRNSTMDMIGNAPANAISRWIGKFCGSKRIPPSVHQRLISFMIRTYGIDVSQIEKPLSEYKTLQEFFSRRLAPGSRPVHPSSILTSPCDGEILQLGVVTDDDMIVQVKGDRYHLDELMQTSKLQFTARQPGTTRWFFLFHLRPKDYHRFHSPATWTIDEAVHIPGTLYPVTSTANKWIPGLFARNERVSVIGRWEFGTIGFVPVGATCVGSISLAFDERIRTNQTSSVTNIWSLFRFASGQDTSLVDGPSDETLRAREATLQSVLKDSPAQRRALQDVFPELDRNCFVYGSDGEATPLATDGPRNASSQNTYGKRVLHDDGRACPTFGKGEELGWFNWGSAIALVVDLPDSMGVKVRPLDEVRVGQPLVSW